MSSLLAPAGTPTAVELARALRTGQLSAREALRDHLTRIEQVNPQVNAIVTLVEEQAWQRAAAADDRAARAGGDGSELPLLHGIPMTHKDTHLTEGIRTTMGSPLLRDLVPPHDEYIIERLRAAGVTSTGKSNVPEFAAGSHTFNEVFGATRNPHDLSRSAGGSSGGAAVALATGIQALADGSDMGGSLRNPASFCGVVGMRPSLGVIPHGPNLDPFAWLGVTGPMARTVDDVVLMLAAVAGPDPRSPIACPADAADFAALLAEPVRADLARLRVGVSTDLGLDLPVEPAVVAAVEGMATTLASLGAHVEPACPQLGQADRVFDVHRALAMATSLRGVIKGHREDGTVKPEVIWNVDRGLALTGADLADATVARGRLELAVRRWFGDYDLLLAPTSQVLPFPVEERWPASIEGVEMTTYVEWMRSCSVISATGCPAISVPAGTASADTVSAGTTQRYGDPAALPVGVQLVAAPGQDVALLRAARVVERAR